MTAFLVAILLGLVGLNVMMVTCRCPEDDSDANALVCFAIIWPLFTYAMGLLMR